MEGDAHEEAATQDVLPMETSPAIASGEVQDTDPGSSKDDVEIGPADDDEQGADTGDGSSPAGGESDPAPGGEQGGDTGVDTGTTGKDPADVSGTPEGESDPAPGGEQGGDTEDDTGTTGKDPADVSDTAEGQVPSQPDGENDPDGGDPSGGGENLNPDGGNADKPGEDSQQGDPADPPVEERLTSQGTLTFTLAGTSWNPGDELTFRWTAVEDAAGYVWTLFQGEEIQGQEPLDDGTLPIPDTADCTLTLPTEGWATGSYTLILQALSVEGEILAEGTLEFSLTEPGDTGSGDPDDPGNPEEPGESENPGNPEGSQQPGGRRRSWNFGSFKGRFGSSGFSGMKSTGSADAAGGTGGTGNGVPPAGSFSGNGRSNGSSREGLPEDAYEAQAFRVVPGVALLEGHISGNRDMTAYGTVALKPQDAADGWLVMDGAALEICRQDGGGFSARMEGDALILDAGEDAPAWRLNLLALEVLRRSGVETLRLHSGQDTLELSTLVELSGRVYGFYRSQGCVSKDMTLLASSAGLAVEIEEQIYGIGGDGALVPGEGDVQ